MFANVAFIRNNEIMINMTILKCLLFGILFTLSVKSYAQGLLDLGETSPSDTLLVTSIRSKNAVSISIGSTLMNGDLENPDFENFLELKLKRFITPKIGVSGNLKKFDIKNYDFKNEGFLSGDLNVEWYVLPDQYFTPYFFVGPGLLISNNFEDKNYKGQAGIGLEYLFNPYIAVVGVFEVNYIYDEQKGSMLMQDANQLYYNAVIGVQFYFGNNKYSKTRKSKKKLSKNEPSIIKSNSIDHY